MNKTEFKVKFKIDSQCIIYEVGCKTCLSISSDFNSDYHWEISVDGLTDGKLEEFYKLENAESAIKLHIEKKPLHEPVVFPPQREYTISDKGGHLIKYRCKIGKGGNVHVHSVDGFRILGEKCAYECCKCGAIYESRGSGIMAGHFRVFPTDDPRCLSEIHELQEMTTRRLCLCLTADEARREHEDELEAKGCVYCHRQFTFTDGIPDVAIYSNDYVKSKGDPEGCVCGVCYCKRKGRHNWISRTRPKTGRPVRFVCQDCNVKGRYFEEIAETDQKLRVLNVPLNNG